MEQVPFEWFIRYYQCIQMSDNIGAVHVLNGKFVEFDQCDTKLSDTIDMQVQKCREKVCGGGGAGVVC